MTDTVKPPRYHDTVPTDQEAERVYAQILIRAEHAGLIIQAYGGVATLAIPSEQRKAGLRDQVLQAIQMNETGGDCANRLDETEITCALAAGHSGAHQDKGGRRRWT